jgi:hypothetical protein
LAGALCSVPRCRSKVDLAQLFVTIWIVRSTGSDPSRGRLSRPSVKTWPLGREGDDRQTSTIPEKPARMDAEGPGDSQENQNAHVPSARLELGHVGGVEARFLGHGFLG